MLLPETRVNVLWTREGEPDRDRVMGWEDETRLTGVAWEVLETQAHLEHPLAVR